MCVIYMAISYVVVNSGYYNLLNSSYAVNHRAIIFMLKTLYVYVFVADTPSNIGATVLTARSIEITWDAFPISSGVNGYLISYTTTASYAIDGSVTVNDVNATSYTLTNLEEGTTYTITVQATSSRGMSDNSDEVSVTTDTAGR